MTTFTSTLSCRKYDSAELSQIDISSPRKNSGLRLWDSSDHEDNAWRGRTYERATAAINDTNGRLSSIFLVGHSWCVGPTIFLAWRVMIFLYMVVTFVVLSVRGAFLTAEISMGIYVAQLLSSFFTVLSSTFVLLKIQKEETHEKRERVTWPQDRLRGQEKCRQSASGIHRRPSNSIKNRMSDTINLFALLFTQNCCVIVVFWNIVFWFRVHDPEREVGSNQTNDLLLHFYNLIPVLYEIVIGCAVFKTLFHIPGSIAVICILVRISNASFQNLSAPQKGIVSEWNRNGEWHILARLLQMLLIYILSCICSSLTQRARQRLIRCL